MKKILLMFIAIMPALAYGMGQEEDEGKNVVRPGMTTGLGRNVPPYYGVPAKKICGWVVPEVIDEREEEYKRRKFERLLADLEYLIEMRKKDGQ